MAKSYSNHLKAVFYAGNILEEDVLNVMKERCMTIQDFSYQLKRSRDKAGIPYGPTTSTILTFTLRMLHPNDTKQFYIWLNDAHPYSCTFLFNASFTENNRLKSYEDAMVVNGYVVDIEDDYNSALMADGSAEQVVVTVKMLVNTIVYKGQNDQNDRKLTIKQ